MFDKHKLLLIISEWDPINLMSHAPDDEYEPEVEEIFKTLEEPLSPKELAMSIRAIFLRQFGDDRFQRSDDECLSIAENIINLARV